MSHTHLESALVYVDTRQSYLETVLEDTEVKNLSYDSKVS